MDIVASPEPLLFSDCEGYTEVSSVLTHLQPRTCECHQACMRSRKLCFCCALRSAGWDEFPVSKPEFMHTQGNHFMTAWELEKRHFHGWAHMLLLDWQEPVWICLNFSVWINLWRLINYMKYLSEVNAQTPIQLNKSWILILKHLSKKFLEP